VSRPGNLYQWHRRAGLGWLEQRRTMMFGLIMYLLGILTVFGAIGLIMLMDVISSIDKGQSLPF
jgi:hypothetical protein